ncbi:MAG: DNA-processing protein DprA [Oscillatoriaceae cyanobacterium Prado104]|jgi:predicted Rossmann fold nucleotide-binding protein DprA/Smf involved in DNA uptake|nr:DNA-processing protein DprA [Oscillatoriaceae cyanobacterium Prado104]
MNHVLPPDTQAILLLCASFGQNRQTEPQPLTLSEYNYLAGLLRENQMRPADLLTPKALKLLQKIPASKIDFGRVAALLERGVMLSLAVEKWTNQGLWILGRSDAAYPKRLKQILQHLAPAILYGIGNIKLLSRGGLAIVGSRDVDAAGLDRTRQIAGACAEQEMQVVSGGARGVDTAAMLSALEVGGTSVGVLSDSLARTAVAGKYRASIKEGRLTLISACDPNAGFNVGNAMARNKYIYALADRALVISCAAGTGGTWAGAVEALEKIKDVPVFVLDDAVPEGNRQLLKRGAQPLPFPLIPGSSIRGKLRTILEGKASELGAIATDTAQNCYEWADANKNQKQQDLLLENTGAVTKEEATNLLTSEIAADRELFNSIPTILPAVTAVAAPASRETDIASNGILENAIARDRTPPVTSLPKDIYEAVLPIILSHLEQPLDEKSLAEILDVQIGQLRLWLKRAVAEGKASKTNNPVAYVIQQKGALLSLIDKNP